MTTRTRISGSRTLFVARLCAFTIAGSLTWGGVMAQSVAPPPIVIRSNTQSATIWAQDRAGAPSANSSVSLGSTTGAGARAAQANSTGSALQVNGNTVAQPSTVVTMANASCPVFTPQWPGPAACTATPVASSIHGTAVTATDPPGYPGFQGSINYVCNNGSWVPQAGSSCTSSPAPTCGASALSWGSPYTCAANFPTTSAGSYATLGSANGNSGTATYLCNAGSWILQSGSCEPPIGSLGSDKFFTYYYFTYDDSQSAGTWSYPVTVSQMASTIWSQGNLPWGGGPVSPTTQSGIPYYRFYNGSSYNSTWSPIPSPIYSDRHVTTYSGAVHSRCRAMTLNTRYYDSEYNLYNVSLSGVACRY